MIQDLSGNSTIKTGKSINSKILMEETYKTDYERKIVWRAVVFFLYVHLGALYGVYMLYCTQAKWLSFVWVFGLFCAAMLGVTAGAHRLWAHRSYKAKWPMRFILMIFQTIAFQYDIYQWARDHRAHHKFTDTDADPYNARRGFFFSHVGWLLVRKHPDVTIKSALVDCSDLKQDPFVVFQRKWYMYMSLCNFIITILVPYWAWNESLWCSWHVAFLRHCLNLNITWLVNSVAHIWGTKPYDKTFSSTNNAGVAFVTLGEGWHNYHHAFPWDYKASELGGSFTTNFINFFAKIRWAYDLKEPSEDLVKMIAMKKGDGSLHLWDAVPHSASKTK